MRRIIGGSAAFLILTGTLLVLPVYAAPAPAAHPVAPSIDEVALGSVVAPSPEADVTTDGELVDPGSVEAGSTAPTDQPSSPETTSPAPSGEPAPPTAVGTTDAPQAPSTSGAAPSASSEDPAQVVSSGDEIPGVAALTTSQPDADTFFSVGVTWADDPALGDVTVQVRVLDAAGNWGEWTNLQPDDIEQTPTATNDSSGVRGGTAPYWTGEAHGAEVIVQGADGTAPEDVQLALIDPGTAAADALPAASTPSATAHADAAMPQVITRAEWGADESIRTWDPEYAPTIKAATIHHTADGNNYTAAQVPAMMRSIYAYHAQTRGWGDIGYNVIVDKFGRIFEGRYGGLTSTVIGAHAGGFNTGTFGVSMLGNYDITPVPQATVDAVAAIIAWKFDLYGVNPRGTTVLTSAGGGTAKYTAGTRVTLPTIFGHRDVGSTTCPGQYGYARLEEIRAQVEVGTSYNPSNIQTTRTDPSTGGIPDVSPSQVSAVVAANGVTTLFALGADAGVWYASGSGSSFGPWRAIPNTVATSGPAAVSWNGSQIDVVVRGGDGAYWRTTTVVDGSGRPSAFGGWSSLGGRFTSAPSVASLSPGRLSVVGRGGDGAAYQLLWNGYGWSGWTSLGGYSYSAPTLSVDAVYGRYLVSTVGGDGRVWQTGTTVQSAGPSGPWVGGGMASSHAVGASSVSAASSAGPVLTTAAASHAVVLLRPDGARQSLGGLMTSVVAVARQVDGSYLLFGRGTDDAVWTARYANGRLSGWISMGGQVR